MTYSANIRMLIMCSSNDEALALLRCLASSAAPVASACPESDDFACFGRFLEPAKMLSIASAPGLAFAAGLVDAAGRWPEIGAAFSAALAAVACFTFFRFFDTFALAGVSAGCSFILASASSQPVEHVVWKLRRLPHSLSGCLLRLGHSSRRMFINPVQ
jgi:hypothetical protein